MRFFSSVGLLIFAYIFFIANSFYSSLIIGLIYVILVYEWHVASYKKKNIIDYIVFIFINFGIFGFCFINFLRSEFFSTHSTKDLMPMVWVILIAILTDTGAYFTGRVIGGYKPFPLISPSKTISGYIGGLIIGGSVPLITGYLYGVQNLNVVQIICLLLIGIFLSISAMAGDLLQSYFKRKNDIKDTGSILPGHGGLFDRFDSILATSMALFLIWCAQIIFGLPI